MKNNHPVFFDPLGKRAKRVKILLSLIVIAVLYFTIVWGLSVWVAPDIVFPKQIGETFSKTLSQKHNSWLPRSLARDISNYRTNLPKFKNSESNVSGEVDVEAFSVGWDDASFASLKQNLSSIDTLVAESLSLSSQGLAVSLTGSRLQEQLDYIRKTKEETRVFALINNFDSDSDTWSQKNLTFALKSQDSASALSDSIIDFLDTNKLDGVSIDFEDMPDSMMDSYYSFLQILYGKLKSHNYALQVNIPVEAGWDYAKIGSIADEVVAMAYDQHWMGGEPGSVAGASWYQKKMSDLVTQIPANKLVGGIAAYGYDWGKKNASATSVSFEDAIGLADDKGVDIEFDSGSMSPHFSYTGSEGAVHQVWFSDAVTAHNQIAFARDAGLGKIAIWRLGNEDPSMWKLFSSKHFDDAIRPDGIDSFSAGYSLGYSGSGEVYAVKAAAIDGKREFNFEEGLIVYEEYISVPSPAQIERFGDNGNPKSLLLSFDDGPDPRFTSQILDILHEKGVPALFFVVGDQIEKNPDILAREISEGHMVGNHTFSHPDITKVGTTRLDFELNLTERLIEGITGKKTLLFRPPYGEDVEPNSPDEIAPLERSTNRHYLTVGMKIDPNDWAGIPAAEIIKRTESIAKSGAGHIVLLHDSGGDRSETVKALPTLIDTLRKDGFQFVGIDSLLGSSKSDLMPISTSREMVFEKTDYLWFSFLGLFAKCISAIFVIAIVVGVTRSFFVFCLAIYHFFLHRKRVKSFGNDSNFAPSVSIIVPAYNEEKVILKTVQSLLKTRYTGKFSILVVDDGSKDSTYEVVSNEYKNHEIVSVYTKENGGKSSAINLGLSLSKSEIIIVVDADTVLDAGAVGYLVRHFSNKNVGAVAGNVLVGNTKKLWPKLQLLEYVSSQNIDRRAFDILNAVSVVPGAIGAWRKSVLDTIGGFSSDTLAEDADATVSVLRAGYKIIADPDAQALTEAPEDAVSFFKQRFRWVFGTLQVAYKHRFSVFDKKVSLGFKLLFVPQVFLFQVIVPIFVPLADIAFLFSVGVGVSEYILYGFSHSFDSIRHALVLIGYFYLIEFILACFGMLLEKNKSIVVLLLFPIQKILYRFVLVWGVGTKALYKVFAGRHASWNKLERKNSVPS